MSFAVRRISLAPLGEGWRTRIIYVGFRRGSCVCHGAPVRFAGYDLSQRLFNPDTSQ